MIKNTGTNLERKFGVEIEFGGDRQKVLEALAAEGIRVATMGWTQHDRRDYSEYEWKLTTDGSVRVDRLSGLELVSPPMTISGGGLDEITKVSKALKNAGAKINKTCGLHVHHDARDFEVSSFKKLYTMYIRYEESIDELVPESRRQSNNSYCRTMTINNDKQNTIDKILAAKDVQEITNIYCGRFYKLNGCSFRAHGTIEFRHHSGTVEAEKIINWVILTQAMVNRATTATVQKKAASSTWFDFKKIIRGYAWMGADEYLQNAVEFFNKRRQDLMKGRVAEAV